MILHVAFQIHGFQALIPLALLMSAVRQSVPEILSLEPIPENGQPPRRHRLSFCQRVARAYSSRSSALILRSHASCDALSVRCARGALCRASLWSALVSGCAASSGASRRLRHRGSVRAAAASRTRRGCTSAPPAATSATPAAAPRSPTDSEPHTAPHRQAATKCGSPPRAVSSPTRPRFEEVAITLGVQSALMLEPRCRARRRLPRRTSVRMRTGQGNCAAARAPRQPKCGRGSARWVLT